MTRVLLTAAEYPDLDGVACAIAYRNYLQQKDSSKQYSAKFGTGLHIEPQYVLDSLGLIAEILDEKESFDEYILVDACEPLGLPSIINNSTVIDVIDHRLFPDYKAFPSAQFRIEPVGAAATQIAEFFYFDQTVDLTSKDAALLLCAIYSNTVNFKSDTTTFRDQRMKEWLESKLDTQDKDLAQRMYAFKTQYAEEHLEQLLITDMHDNCNQFGEGINAVLYQAEVAGAENLLSRKEEIFDLFKKIKADREYQMLIIQDANKGKTHIISHHIPVIQALQETALKGIAVDVNEYVVPGITMRKSIKKALLERQK